jgi:hypothetical protein
MRQSAVDKVNAHARAVRAAERVSGNGTVHGIFDTPEDSPHDKVTFVDRIKRLFPQPEVLDVAGRQVKGIVLTPVIPYG